MTALDVVSMLALVFGGMLAGAEYAVRFGVRGPLARLDDVAHIRMRQGLIGTLRWLVPALALPALGLDIAALVIGGFGPGCVFRIIGVVAIVVWTVATFAGTVPVNSAVLTWDPEAPPADWQRVIERWEALALVRAIATAVAFVAFVIATVR